MDIWKIKMVDELTQEETTKLHKSRFSSLKCDSVFTVQIGTSDSCRLFLVSSTSDSLIESGKIRVYEIGSGRDLRNISARLPMETSIYEFNTDDRINIITLDVWEKMKISEEREVLETYYKLNYDTIKEFIFSRTDAREITITLFYNLNNDADFHWAPTGQLQDLKMNSGTKKTVVTEILTEKKLKSVIIPINIFFFIINIRNEFIYYD